jgi:hypothetical protein
VHKDDLKDARNDYEDASLRRLAEVLSDGVTATILAGFADTKLFKFLTELGFGYVIRLKGNTRVRAADGTTRPAADWIGPGAQAARRYGHRGALPGWRGRMRTRPEHEGALVPGDQQL